MSQVSTGVGGRAFPVAHNPVARVRSVSGEIRLVNVSYDPKDFQANERVLSDLVSSLVSDASISDSVFVEILWSDLANFLFEDEEDASGRLQVEVSRLDGERVASMKRV